MQAREHRHRDPQFARQTGFGAGEPLRRHTDNHEVHTIDADISAYQIRIAAEAPPP
ncbi:MAG: hypothetical protein J2P21_06615 [Chloracidobacterium sp.]|nr:hypothetical protein [Chloracidobacterium sp.]